MAVYYDNGKIELSGILNAVFSIQFSNMEFRIAESQKQSDVLKKEERVKSPAKKAGDGNRKMRPLKNSGNGGVQHSVYSIVPESYQ